MRHIDRTGQLLMSFALIIIVIVTLGVFGGAALTGFFVGRLASGRSSLPAPDPRLVDQTDRIAALEDELHRVREQADFTERLLTERSVDDEGDLPPV